LLTICRHSTWHCCAYWQSFEPQPCWASVETTGRHVTWRHGS